jgi:hypothetical protein
LAGHRKVWVASGGTFTLPAQLTFVAALNIIISWSPDETTKLLHVRPLRIAVYGYGCIVRVGADTQIADLLVEEGAHPLEKTGRRELVNVLLALIGRGFSSGCGSMP